MMRWILIILGSIVGLILLCVVVLFFMSKRPEMKTMTGSLVIDRPAAEVWTWITEPAQLVQWVSWLTEVKTITPGEKGVGHQVVWVMDDPNMNEMMEIPGTVTMWDPPKQLGLHIDMKEFGTGEYTYTLSELDGRTTITQSGTFDYTHPVWSIMVPLIMPEARKKMDSDLAKLKQVAEAAPVAPVETLASSDTTAAVAP